MGNDHEYTLLGGVNRATIGRVIATTAATITAVLVFLILSLIDVAEKLNIDVNLPPSVFSLIGAGVIYGILYFVFSKFIWKWSPISKVMNVPDLSGQWKCFGKSNYGSDGIEWEGLVRISQNWDKLCIVLTTTKSRSESVSAALVSEGVGSYRLLYHYKNEPRKFEDDLMSHHGFVDVIISEGLDSADGVYFTGRGRTTFGTMNWTKE